jgi:hypothetical protein
VVGVNVEEVFMSQVNMVSFIASIQGQTLEVDGKKYTPILSGFNFDMKPDKEKMILKFELAATN